MLGCRIFLLNQKSINYQLNKIIMKAKTMNVLDLDSNEIKFGVKIQINNRRSVFLSKDKKIFSVDIKKEAQKEADYINILIRNNGINGESTEQKLMADKSIKVVSF